MAIPYRKPRKNMRRRRRVPRRKRVSTAPRMNRVVAPMKVYPFSRQREQLLALEDPDAGATGWISTFDDSVVKTFTWSLNELPNYGEFTALFRQYKLNMGLIKIFPSYSQVVSATGSVASNNIIVTIWANNDGQPLTAAFTKAELAQIQSKNQFMFPMNRPTTIRMPLKQLDQVYNSTVNTDYTVAKPKYISTAETSTPHYGMNVHICRVDGSTFGSDSARLKIMEKIYLTCRQVH